MYNYQKKSRPDNTSCLILAHNCLIVISSKEKLVILAISHIITRTWTLKRHCSKL